MFSDKELIFTAETTPDLSMDLESSVNKIIPLVIVVSNDARAKTEPSIGPMHGDHPNPNPIPTKKDI